MGHKLFKFAGLPTWVASWLATAIVAGAMPVSELQKQLVGGTKLTLVDIRSPLVFAKEHIPGAINIPASLCSIKQLPPLGKVVVCGDGLGTEDVVAAAAALAAKPGLQVEILEGGFAAWKNTQTLTTRGAGFKRESFNYISYARLKAAKPGKVILYDLRKPTPANSPPLTDLNVELPGLKQAKFRTEAVQMAASSSLIVLIDSGDLTSEREARQLKLSGTHNYVILAGGEMILARHGQAGLQRNSGSYVINSTNAVNRLNRQLK